MTDYCATKNRMEQGGDKWAIGAGGQLVIEDGGTLSLEEGSILDIANGGALDVSEGSDLDIEDGASLDVESGGEINIESGGAVTFDSGSTLTFEAGATVTGLSGETTFASGAEAIAGVVTDKVIAPYTLKAAMDAKLAAMAWNAVITVGSEADNNINVGIQLKDIAGADLAVRGSVMMYLADDANGDGITTTAPSVGIAIGTDGLAIPLVANKCLQLVSESDGDIDLDIGEASAGTWYLIVVLPNGKLVASAAITFAGAG